MKKNFSKLFALLIVCCSAVFFGCMSAQQLLERGDTVRAIEKLAKSLTKKSTNQEDADLFHSVYPSEVERRLTENTDTVSDVVNRFVNSQGAATLFSALANIKSRLPSGSFVGEDSSVRHAIYEAEAAYTIAEDLYRIQKAVKPMPTEIGDPRKGQIYLVEKYTDDFTSKYNTAGKDLAEFIFSIADAGYPGYAIGDKKKDYDMYDKAAKYDSSLSSECRQRQARLAYDIGEILLSQRTISDKKDALEWFKKSDNKVSNYNGVKTKILQCNYEIASIYFSQFERTGSISDLRDAITYYRAAKDYSDAPSMLAYCESLLYDLEHPRTVDDDSGNNGTSGGNGGTGGTGGYGGGTGGTGGSSGGGWVQTDPYSNVTPIVTFGNLSYSDGSPTASTTIKISGLSYVLSSSDFRIYVSSGAGRASVSVSGNGISSQGTALYVVTLTDIRNSGTLNISIYDRRGVLIGTSPEYRINVSNVRVRPTMSYADEPTYLDSEPEVNLFFTVYNRTRNYTERDLVVKKNTTGGRISRVFTVSSGNGFVAVLSDVTKDGTIAFSIIDDDGTAIATDTGDTLAVFDIKYDRIYSPKDVWAQAVKYSSTPLEVCLPFGTRGFKRAPVDADFTVTYNSTDGYISGINRTSSDGGYEFVLSGVKKSGTVRIAFPGAGGKEISYSVDIGRVTQKPISLRNTGTQYSTDKSEVYLLFLPSDSSKVFSLSDISVDLSSTGGSVVGLTRGSQSDSYRVIISGIKRSGNVTLYVKGSDGNYLREEWSFSNKLENPYLTYSIDASQIFVAPPEPKVVFDSEITYSNEEQVATFNIAVANLDYELKDSNFEKKLVSGNIGLIYVSPVRDMTSASVKRMYSGSFTDRDENLRLYKVNVSKMKTQTASFTMTAKDSSGKVIGTSRTYSVLQSKMFVPKVMISDAGLSYSTVANEAYLEFTISDTMRTLSLSDMYIDTSATDGNMTFVKTQLPGKYRIVLRSPKRSGTVRLYVKGTDGKYLEARDKNGSETGLNYLEYSIDISKVYEQVAAKLVSDGVSYPDDVSEAHLGFTVSGVTKSLTTSDLLISNNMTGGKVKSIKSTGKAGGYVAVLTGATSSGKISISVLGDDGKALQTGSSSTLLTYSVDLSKIYVVPTIKASTATYSTTAPEATFTITVTGLKYALSESNFQKKTTGNIGSVTVRQDTGSSQTSDSTRVYIVTVSNLTSGDGTVKITVKDNSGKTIGSTQTYQFSASRMYVPPASTTGVSASAFELSIIDEINLMRSNPKDYAEKYIKPQITSSSSSYWTSCVSDMSKITSLGKLSYAEGLYKLAKAHSSTQGQTTNTGHDRTNGDSFSDAVKKYGRYSYVGENISYGKDTARGIVIQLLVDDGVESLGHRLNLLNTRFESVGVSYDTHKRYRVMCVMDFAAGWTDK